MLCIPGQGCKAEPCQITSKHAVVLPILGKDGWTLTLSSQIKGTGTFLVVDSVAVVDSASIVGGTGLIPGQGVKILNVHRVAKK